MKMIITNATVCDPGSPHNGRKCDILVNNHHIDDIQPAGRIKVSGHKSFDATGLTLVPGFMDMRASLRDPGFEYKEDLESAARAAAAGGYTTLVCLPNTSPTLQNKADIEFILRKAEPLPVHILPYGAITRNREGVEMNELYDMHKAGAVGFTDGNKTIMQAGVMERALQYATIFGSLVLSHAEDTSIAGSGMMHEGPTSTQLGLKGIPRLAEDLVVNRDIELARYTHAPLHISHISSKGSVELIRKARKSGLKVTCDVAVANLVWTDDVLDDFDSNFKLSPPLRGRDDQKALWAGLLDGTIDCIVSDHTPEDPERKDLEFEYAAQGMIQLQTAFSAVYGNRPAGFPLETLIRALSVNPRKVLKQPAVVIEKGGLAELTLVDLKKDWEYTTENNLSKSRNSPLLGSRMKASVVATINKSHFYSHA